MRNTERNRLILPLACCAILSVATFSGIGIAAITGQLSVGSGNAELFQTNNELITQDSVPDKWSVPVAKPTHVGLTRSAVNGDDANSKSMLRRVSQRFSQTLKPACDRCGVVQSIERHALQMPTKRGLNSVLAMKASSDASSSVTLRASVLTGSKQSSYVERSRNFDGATSFIVRLRMEDGSFRTIFEHQHPKFSIGEKVQLVDGAVISIG